MTDQSFDEQGEAHEAMSSVVSSYGARVLSNPQMLRNLVADLLPDLPRERSLLVSAAEAGVATEMTQYVDEQHIDAQTAVQLVARALSERTMIDSTASMWVTTEFAQALGYPAGPVSRPARPGPPTQVADIPGPPGMVPPLAGYPPPGSSAPQYQETMTAGQYQDAATRYPETGAHGGGDQIPFLPDPGHGGIPSLRDPGLGQVPSLPEPGPQAWGAPGAGPQAWGGPGASVPSPGPQGWSDQGASAPDPGPQGWGASVPPQGPPAWGGGAAPGPGGWPASGAPPRAAQGWSAQGWSAQGGTAPVGAPPGWGSQGGAAPAGGAPGWPPPGAYQPPGGYQPPRPPRRRRGPLIAILAGAGVLVLYLAVIAPVARIFPFGGKAAPSTSPIAVASQSVTPAPSPAASASLAAGVATLTQLLPSDVDQPDTECQAMKAPYHWANPGLVQALSCSDPGLKGGTVYAYQMDSAADFAAAFRNFNTWWGFDFAKAQTNCPPAAGQQGTTGWNDNFFPQRANQSLECSMVGSGASSGPAYAYAYPTEDAFILAQAAPDTTFKALDSWWTDNAGPAVSPTPATP
jgi:hypothetical protein